MNKYGTLLIPLASVAGTGLAAQTVKIGVLAPITGFAASDGASVKNSIKLAVDYVNANGGVLGKKVEALSTTTPPIPSRPPPWPASSSSRTR